MLGSFQHSALRIEVEASETLLRESLTLSPQLQTWLWPQMLAPDLPEHLYAGLSFTSQTGPITVAHYVEIAQPNRLQFILSQGIDGYHDWSWGEGWVQSRLEGISLLPLKIGQTLTLLRLRAFLWQQQQSVPADASTR